ncbi:MAG: pentapeptide repeat-containing protein, partial [Polyangiaceae bacterium]
NLSRANLEGANLLGANLVGARLSHAQLDLANLGGADLTGAQLTHCDLVEAYLGGAKLEKADLTNANISSSNIEEANFSDAILLDTRFNEAQGRGVRFSRAIMLRADLSKATLIDADFTNTDARRVIFANAKLSGAKLTGAKLFGITPTTDTPENLKVEWIDMSSEGDGSKRVLAAQVVAVLTGQSMAAAPAAGRGNVRYFGRGDVLRNASLQFDDGACIEIESLFEHCTIALGNGTELIVGTEGVLSGCQITGAGNITINGKFIERDSPGIVGASQLIVSSGGSLVGAVEQPPEWTRFAFEPGCVLRMKIMQSKDRSRRAQ